jgi:hypothetical protein
MMNGDESKDETGDGERKALVEFDASFTPVFGMIVEEIGERAFRIAESALGGGTDGGDFNGPVGALESGEGVVIRIGAREFMGGAAIEVQL